mgnify:FL=1
MLDLPTARRVVSVVCADLGVTPVYPDDLAAIYRATLVGAFAAWRRLQGKSYPVADALRDESFAIPGLPSAAAALVPLITGVPVVGPVLADVMGAALEDRLYFAPAACKDGVTLVATAARLLSYATTWQRGVGVAFAAAWLAIGEARAGLGAQAAVQGAQVRVALGVSVVEAFAEAQAHVASLDLDATDRALADGIVEHGEVSLVDAAAAELDGPSLPLLRALKDAGVSLALDVA